MAHWWLIYPWNMVIFHSSVNVYQRIPEGMLTTHRGQFFSAISIICLSNVGNPPATFTMELSWKSSSNCHSNHSHHCHPDVNYRPILLKNVSPTQVSNIRTPFGGQPWVHTPDCQTGGLPQKILSKLAWKLAILVPLITSFEELNNHNR